MEATRFPPCLPVPPLTPKRVVATGPRRAESRNRHWTPQCLFLVLPASGLELLCMVTGLGIPDRNEPAKKTQRGENQERRST